MELRNLTELRCPRSSRGSFRSLTASITADKRSPSFFSGFADLLDGVDKQDDDDEARLRLEPPPWPTAIIDKDESSAVDLRTRDDKDEETVLARRAAMAKAEALQSFLGLVRFCFNFKMKELGLVLWGPFLDWRSVFS
ncbi:hypothetical protein PanWU01x14_183580, partial [Parasponia andersonii]